MKFRTETFLLLLLLATGFVAAPQNKKACDAVYSGIPWFDNHGKVVSAHGACLVKDKGRYFLFGERHTDTSNAFAGFACYSSDDLYNWTFESLALPVQDSGKLGPGRVGERAKVMRCPKTGEYVMYMHVDSLTYKDQFLGYATSGTVTGPYTFRGALLFDGKPVRKWDMGTFQDKDGAGYVLIHGGEIYKLGEDYKSITEQVNKAMTPGFEAPAMFRKDSVYYFLGSNLTSWERNDNYYYTAASLKGPWTARGLFCPEGTLTWNSQTSFVFPVEGKKETTYLFMGDRWSAPKQASAATYVWQPIAVSGSSLSISNYAEAWRIDAATGKASSFHTGNKTIKNTAGQVITYTGKWQNDTLSLRSSDEKNASFSVRFNGTRIGFYGLARPTGGYARLLLCDGKGRTVLSCVADMYCRYPVTRPAFLSPLLPKGNYTLTVSVAGERSNWSDKRRADYGGTGYFVSLDRVIVDQ